MKKVMSLLLILGMILGLCGCNGSKSNMTEMEKIQKQLNEMEGYQCKATMKRISNKGENTYETKQYYKSTGEYRLELTAPETVAGNYTVFDGEKVCQYNPRIAGKIVKKVPESQQRNELFLGQFVKNYMQSEEVAVDAAAMDETKCTVLEAVIPGKDTNLSTEKLWVDNKTLKPVQFIIYDQKGKERYILNYTDFEYNPTLKEDLFTIKEE